MVDDDGPGREDPGSILRRQLDGGGIQLDIEDILACLPHRQPGLMIDRILSLVPGRHGVAIKAVSGDEYGLCSRRFGFVFPSSFAIEAVAQLASVILTYPSENHRDPESEFPPMFELAGVLSLDVHREMVAGAPMYVSATILRRSDEGQSEEGRVLVTGQLLLAGEPYIDTRIELARFRELDQQPRGA